MPLPAPVAAVRRVGPKGGAVAAYEPLVAALCALAEARGYPATAYKTHQGLGLC